MEETKAACTEQSVLFLFVAQADPDLVDRVLNAFGRHSKKEETRALKPEERPPLEWQNRSFPTGNLQWVLERR